jgi:hypothetical protein
MKGALPPSSSESFLIVEAHCAISRRPTSVDPVNDNFRTRELAVSAPPMASGSPVSTFSTPAGRRAACARRASASAVSGVCSAGLTTTVQPAASAGATLRVIIASGKFHGVIAAQTPTGWRIVSSRRSAAGLGMVSP